MWSSPRLIRVYVDRAVLPSQTKHFPWRLDRLASRQGKDELNPISMSQAGRCRVFTQSRKLRVCRTVGDPNFEFGSSDIPFASMSVLASIVGGSGVISAGPLPAGIRRCGFGRI